MFSGGVEKQHWAVMAYWVNHLVKHRWWNFYAKITNDQNLLTIFVKSSLLDIWQAPKYTSL